jgi:hypothetical protein
MRSRRILTAVIAALVAMGTLSRPSAGSETLASSYAIVRKSLALVAYRYGNGMITGSAFCVASFNGYSYFLTNAHVVRSQRRVALILASGGKPRTAIVLKENPDYDAAILVVQGVVPALRLGRDRLSVGQTIAIAGYPGSNIDLAFEGLGLSPAVHEGILNAYELHGSLMEFDAQVEHGNSGGPVFDPNTGVVYGLVMAKVGNDQTNLGISISVLFPFLDNAHLPILGATQAGNVVASASTPPPQPEPPAARMSPPPTPNALEMHIPLSNRDAYYTCNGGIGMEIDIRETARGSYVTQSYTGTNIAPTTSLLAHDDTGNVVILGIGKTARRVRLFPSHIMIPLHPSSDIDSGTYNVDGTFIPQHFQGTAKLHGFDAQVYVDQYDGYVTRNAYANNFGLIAMEVSRTNGAVVLDCDFSAVHE